jgi:Na+-transporting NADH:ubiquinone oxidoreductase subunit NqrD
MINKKKNFNLFRISAVSITAAPVIIISTSRLAFALISALSIAWVYVFSVMIIHYTKKFFPKKEYGTILMLFIFSFTGSLYFFIIQLLNPMLAMETMLLIMLAPVICFTSKICLRIEDRPFSRAFLTAIFEAVNIGLFLVFLSVLREPLGYGTLSLPGGNGGIKELFHLEGGVFPIELIACSSGALFLSGYLLIVIRLIKQKRREEPK